jgi:hypothetical protein
MSPNQNFTEVVEAWPSWPGPIAGSWRGTGCVPYVFGSAASSSGMEASEAGGTFLVPDRVFDCAEVMRTELARVTGVALYVRDLAPDESYFWK